MYETERLILRNWEDKDIGPFILMHQDHRMADGFIEDLNKEECALLVQHMKDKLVKLGFGIYVCELKTNKQFAGMVGLNIPDFDLPINPCIEIGWTIDYNYWGQGLAVEAALKCFSIGFNEFNFEEVISFTSLKNLRSQRVMQKLLMLRDQKQDFLHPELPSKDTRAPQVVYRMPKIVWESIYKK